MEREKRERARGRQEKKGARDTHRLRRKICLLVATTAKSTANATIILKEQKECCGYTSMATNVPLRDTGKMQMGI